MKDFTPALAAKVITSRAVNRFKITARLAQCAAKQAKEIVRSQKERKINMTAFGATAGKLVRQSVSE